MRYDTTAAESAECLLEKSRSPAVELGPKVASQLNEGANLGAILVIGSLEDQEKF